MRAHILPVSVRGLVVLACLATVSGPLAAQVREAFDAESIVPSQEVEVSSTRDLAAIAAGVVKRTNGFRGDEKRREVTVNDRLRKTAEDFARYMAKHDKYGHGADGRRPAERAAAHDYEYCIVSENIAYRFTTRDVEPAGLAEKFFTGWKNSPGHRENMLDPDVTETGVGVAQSDKTGYYYAVQMFGRPKSAAIEFSLVNRSGDAVEYRIGEKTFELPARYARTHHQCRPPTVEFVSENAKKALDPLKPKPGQRLVLDKSQGELRVEPQ